MKRIFVGRILRDVGHLSTFNKKGFEFQKSVWKRKSLPLPAGRRVENQIPLV